MVYGVSPEDPGFFPVLYKVFFSGSERRGTSYVLGSELWEDNLALCLAF